MMDGGAMMKLKVMDAIILCKEIFIMENSNKERDMEMDNTLIRTEIVTMESGILMLSRGMGV